MTLSQALSVLPLPLAGPIYAACVKESACVREGACVWLVCACQVQATLGCASAHE
eukprot:COSAG05_NODE_15802_length_360_cov_1418.264368_1_plen_54_part_10